MKTLLASLFGFILATTSAQATFHLWQITQLYSDPTGTVQFIELFTGTNGQQFPPGTTIMSNSTRLLSHGPSSGTANDFSIATPGYLAVSGLPDT